MEVVLSIEPTEKAGEAATSASVQALAEGLARRREHRWMTGRRGASMSTIRTHGRHDHGRNYSPSVLMIFPGPDGRVNPGRRETADSGPGDRAGRRSTTVGAPSVAPGTPPPRPDGPGGVAVTAYVGCLGQIVGLTLG
jgi:hypothetical protein